MDSNQYKTHILKTYNINSREFGQFIKIDAMSHFLKSLERKGIIFKGALNLMVNFGYRRERLTSDIDLSLSGIDIGVFGEFVIEAASSIKDDIYAYEVMGMKELDITSNGYDGISINVKASVRGMKVRTSFSIDIAIEELGYQGTLKVNGIDIYSIERTLADKYVSMIQRGTENSRGKDFVDLKNLISLCDQVMLIDLIKKLIIARKVSSESLDSFYNTFHKYKFVKLYKLEKVIGSLVRETTNQTQ